MAGTTSSGQSRAMHSVDSKSSHSPCASLARKSVEAGAIKIASASRDRALPMYLGVCGADTRKVLDTLGIDAATQQRLFEAGVLKTAP